MYMYMSVYTRGAKTRSRGQKICPCDVNQGRPTRGPRKGFEWFTQYFLKPSVASSLAEMENRSRKSETNFRRRPFFFRDQCDFLEIKVKMALGSKTLDTPDVCGTKNFCMLLKLTKIFAPLH